MEIKNKPLFYTGLGFQLVPLFIGIMYGLSLLDYTWVVVILHWMKDVCKIVFNVGNLKYYLGALTIVLYETASFLMMWAGCKE